MAKKYLNEEQVSSLIYRMVRESLEAMPSNFNFEESNSDNSGNSQDNGSESSDFKRKRLQIQKFFSQDGVNPAAYAYNLFDVEPVEGNDTNEMKNARSLFMKKLHNEQNQDGSTYDFTSEEVNTLHSLISGDEISESKNGKVLMNEEQFTNFITEMVNESIKRLMNENGLRYGLSKALGTQYAKNVDREAAAKKKAQNGDYSDWEKIQNQKRMGRMAKNGTLTQSEYLRNIQK